MWAAVGVPGLTLPRLSWLATTATSLENVECRVHIPVHSPVHDPVQNPVHDPVQSPVHPVYSPIHGPVQSPEGPGKLII